VITSSLVIVHGDDCDHEGPVKSTPSGNWLLDQVEGRLRRPRESSNPDSRSGCERPTGIKRPTGCWHERPSRVWS